MTSWKVSEHSSLSDSLLSRRIGIVGVLISCTIGAILVAQLIVYGLRPRILEVGLFAFCASLYLGRFLFLRSRGQEASLVSTRVRSGDDDALKIVTHGCAIASDAVLLLGTIAAPWL
jgi:hypothetical protein